MNNIRTVSTATPRLHWDVEAKPAKPVKPFAAWNEDALREAMIAALPKAKSPDAHRGRRNAAAEKDQRHDAMLRWFTTIKPFMAEPTTTRDIAAKLGLQPAGLSSVMRGLRQRGYIEDLGMQKNELGTPVTFWRVAEKGREK